MQKLEGKVALVTGGNGSLGKGIVKALLAEGAKVAFCGRNEQKNQEALAEFQALNGDVFAIQCDISNSRDVVAMYEKLIDHYGTLDILVNNAAVTSGGGFHKNNGKTDRENYLDLSTKPGPKFSLEITKNMTDEEWDQCIHINLNGTFYCTREALKIMESKRSGKIINVASTAGISNGSPHSPSYCASKGAIVAFTKNLAVEVIGAGVIVNAIAPGAIETEAFRNFTQAVGPDVTGRFLQSIPANRMGTIAEHASLVAYLASDDANYIVGQVISANGGLI